MVIRNPPSPCDGCKRNCNYTQCREYRLWLNQCWRSYRQWPDQWHRESPDPNFWRYDPPTLLKDYLDKGPCDRCPVRHFCGQNTTCPAYETWTKDRARRLAIRLGIHKTILSTVRNQQQH